MKFENHCSRAPKFYANVLLWAPSSVTRRGAQGTTAAACRGRLPFLWSRVSRPVFLLPSPHSQFPPGVKPSPRRSPCPATHPHQTIESRGRQQALVFFFFFFFSLLLHMHEIIILACSRSAYSRTVQQTLPSPSLFQAFFKFARVHTQKHIQVWVPCIDIVVPKKWPHLRKRKFLLVSRSFVNLRQKKNEWKRKRWHMQLFAPESERLFLQEFVCMKKTIMFLLLCISLDRLFISIQLRACESVHRVRCVFIIQM